MRNQNEGHSAVQALTSGSFAAQPRWAMVTQENGFAVTEPPEFLREARNPYFCLESLQSLNVVIKNNFLKVKQGLVYLSRGGGRSRHLHRQSRLKITFNVVYGATLSGANSIWRICGL